MIVSSLTTFSPSQSCLLPREVLFAAMMEIVMPRQLPATPWNACSLDATNDAEHKPSTKMKEDIARQRLGATRPTAYGLEAQEEVQPKRRSRMVRAGSVQCTGRPFTEPLISVWYRVLLFRV